MNDPLHPAAPSGPDRRAGNRAFWESRGRGATGPGYSSTMIAEDSRLTTYIHRRELSYLARRLPPGARVLDLGCGEGRLALSLSARVREVVGLDLSAGFVERARAEAARRSLANVSFMPHDLERPFGRDRFDVVLLSGVLNYLEEDTAAATLGRAREALVPGGLLYLRNNCANRAPFFRPADGGHPPTYHRTGPQYVAAVTAAGFAVLEERFLYAPLLLPNLVYHHLLPRALRDRRLVARILDTWFGWEERTSEWRLRRFGRLYGPVLRLIRKPTSLRVLLARSP